MVHLIHKSHVNLYFYAQNTMTIPVLLKTHYFGRKVEFQPQKISMRTQKSCLGAQKKAARDPKKVARDPKKAARLSQHICLTIVRNIFWDLF